MPAGNSHDSSPISSALTAAHGGGDSALSAVEELTGLLGQFQGFQRALFDLQGRCQGAISRLQREHAATQRRRAESREKLDRMRQDGARIVKLNVGGARFDVGEGVLKRYPGSFFSVLLEGNFAVDTDEDGAIFIDRDPALFRDILHFLRTGDVPPVPTRPCPRCQLASAQASPSFAGAGGPLPPPHATAGSAAAAGAGGTAVEGAHGGSMAGVAQQRALPVVPATATAPADYSAEFKLLEEEARYYGLTELCMRLSADRGVWHRQDEHHVVDGVVPSPRCFTAAALADTDTMYFFGGCTADDKFFDAFYVLRAGESTAGQIAAARSRAAAGIAPAPGEGSATGGDGAVLSGGDTAAGLGDGARQQQQGSSPALGASSEAPPRRPGDTVDTFTWQRVRARYGQPPSPRSGHTMSHVAGHLIVIGGNNSVTMESSCHAFNINAAGWTPVRCVGEPLLPRSGHTVTVVNDELYLIGGKQIFPAMLTYNDVLIGRYDADEATITWRRAPVDVEVDQRAYHSAVGYREQIFIFGGIVNNVYCRELCVYNTRAGTWTIITPANTPGYSPPPPRSGHVAVLYGNEMVVLGSYSEETSQMSLVALDLDTLTWRTVDAQGHGPLRRAAPSGVVLPADSFRGKAARLVVFGGFDIAARRCFNELHVISL